MREGLFANTANPQEVQTGDTRVYNHLSDFCG
jgi:hypothetical protein